MLPVENIISTSFDKQLSTYSLNGNILLSGEPGILTYQLSEKYKSTLIRSSVDNIRDEQHFSLTTSAKLDNKIKIGLAALNTIYSDNRQIEINQASVSSAFLFSEYIPSEQLIISPYFGYSNNRQIGENDYGYLYGAEGSLNNFSLTDMQLDSWFKLKNEDISPRKNLERYFLLGITNTFDVDVKNIVTTSFSQNRKDFYYTADSVTASEFGITNNIQSRTETNYTLQDNLTYNRFFDIFSLDLFGRLKWRLIDRDTRYRSVTVPSTSLFDTKVEEINIEIEANTKYTSESLLASLKLYFSERDERHITKRFEGIDESFYVIRSETESEKNNNSVRGSLSLSGLYLLSRSDNLSFSFFQSRLRYDTPAKGNDDDRDEILSILRLKFTHSFSEFFEAFASIEGTLSHIVYLFASRSSNNNINRILSLSTGGEYKGKNITSKNTFTVSANYTVFDFEDLNPNFRSFSFRQFTATDSSGINITDKLRLNLYGYLKLSEQGDLNWAEFSTLPTRFLQEIYAEPKLKVIYSDISFALGARFFLLKNFNYQGLTRIPDSEYRSIGPLTEIILTLSDNLYWKIYGWYEFIKINKTENRELTALNMQLNWNF
ncbi:MAG: hypothetical protein Kow0098_24880 [Ignavibacteriaceae bacterium]